MPTNVARAAPAGTGRDPRITDRLSGAIEIISTSTAGHAAATDAAHHDRAWWRAEARRLGSDLPGVLALHVEVVNTWQRRHKSNFDGSAEEGRRAAARALAAMPPRRKAGAP
jgi:hypothetical protein